MNNRNKPMNVQTQVQVATRSTSLVSFLFIALFAALVTAMAFIG
ncbi:MAG TPA: hypothetical protein QF694_06110 [Dehalococcoidia bacterium]|jgi:hypothetical protein|nr:hypothetical protein [Dehalococcoidia bacterium]MDP7261196.1 hypothetical protein [Dehalococcoidia bacterium]MDP7485893.1 hypothetical protein [Dehalococcoidia bacterium]HJP28363.1 hypothetical protein [Dehalococcoidia bacterium]|tara:strand:+ start:3208 stop:3339 length:132 start_codon:yes stop_codon:yes gene_type:complete